MENLKIESADIRVSNSNEQGRALAITANARILGGKVSNINAGNVSSPDGQTHIASFDSWGPGQLNIQFQTDSDRPATLAAVEQFISQVRSTPAIAATSLTASHEE